jgi:hypothetical protein
MKVRTSRETREAQKPLGDHENLYRRGLSAATGSGSPPQRETSSSTEPPWLWMWSMALMIIMWSMPGSNPT